MKKSRFPEEPMAAVLREADRMPVAEGAGKPKVSEQTIYIRCSALTSSIRRT